ncbi:cysteine methyltransferase [Kocuria rosea]|uniref:methylated-DNA--[protein]-cysteine S-methyltransferase n=1 Tax=Kocuria rosea TaxID=1275 RepID=UPI000D643606|nr:methylated-DNA--[protein]-cysteine S-methyltransferase [Kocuria rosea]PWF85155.1 cysteine methyltransferase [Kocuria rosea]QCY31544.1 methylated-DNA--[protein]-cysteine S-methyltransferase [Kocuria rosea]TQN38927.1 methylated-DNA-[protein]-cysteine S-methyltransferase [Kocuria rosea]
MTTNTLGSTPRSPLRSLRADPVPETVLRGLHRRLEEGAARAGLLDVAFTTVSTPVGVLLLAATEEGLVRVAYAREDHEAVLQDLARRISPRVLHAPVRLAPAVRQLEEYFAGTRTGFDLPLDRSLSHGFRRLVQEHLPEIGYGRTESYGAVARSVGRPQAVRAVGTACATNPLPVVVPCHRVLRGDGGLGGYVGGLEAKAALLELEAAA